MAWAMVAGAGISAGTAIYKGIKGAQQTKAAKELAARNPGYQMNQGVIDNAKTLSDQYGNYQLPGYSQIANGINTTYQNAFDSGKQGATTGSDVMDLAVRTAYGKNSAFNQLGEQNAAGKQAALGSYLNANAAAGQEYVNKNAYDRDQYNDVLKEKAALTQAGAENTYGAIDQLAGAVAPAIGKMSFAGSTYGKPLSGVNSSLNVDNTNPTLNTALPTNNPFADSSMVDTNAISALIKKYNRPN